MRSPQSLQPDELNMKIKQVDLLLVVDTSESMSPCFGLLKQHLSGLLNSLKQSNFEVRVGLLGYAAGMASGEIVYDFSFVGGTGSHLLRGLYSSEVNRANYFGDAAKVADAIGRLKAQGNEDTLLAIDTAADFPFAPVNTCRRVIAVFTDEPLEEGVSNEEPLAFLSHLIDKLASRRIQLFVAAPESNALWELGSLEGCQIETISGGDGLKNVDFRKLLESMGKTISMNSLQSDREGTWQKAIFGQDKWSGNKTTSAQNREVILQLGEACNLSNMSPLTRINIKLQWTLGVDLDLHAFFRLRNGKKGHIYFAHRDERGISLDRDAGVTRNRGQHEENLAITELDQFDEVIFATQIFSFFGTKHSYSSYDGKVIVETNNGDRVLVPLTSQERKPWCAIAKLTNPAGGRPKITNLNVVLDRDPEVGTF
jgi:uncharacterized protein involved in tellurium resistance